MQATRLLPNNNPLVAGIYLNSQDMEWEKKDWETITTFPSRSLVVNWPIASAWDSIANTIKMENNKLNQIKLNTTNKIK